MNPTEQTLRNAGYTLNQDGSWSRRTPRGEVRLPKQLWEQIVEIGEKASRAPKEPKPLLNKTEARYLAKMESQGCTGILTQAITLRLDPPFKSYRPDLAYMALANLTFVEVKGPHRFREKGIAKAALAAKTYPQFRFELVEWTGKEWKESVLTP